MLTRLRQTLARAGSRWRQHVVRTRAELGIDEGMGPAGLVRARSTAAAALSRRPSDPSYGGHIGRRGVPPMSPKWLAKEVAFALSGIVPPLVASAIRRYGLYCQLRADSFTPCPLLEGRDIHWPGEAAIAPLLRTVPPPYQAMLLGASVATESSDADAAEDGSLPPKLTTRESTGLRRGSSQNVAPSYLELSSPASAARSFPVTAPTSWRSLFRVNGRSKDRDTVARSKAAFVDQEPPAITPGLLPSAASEYVLGRRITHDIAAQAVPRVDRNGRVSKSELDRQADVGPGTALSTNAAKVYLQRNHRFHRGISAISQRKRIAVLGGAFHPLTEAHLLLVTEILAANAADEVWVVPCGARPDKASLTMDTYERFASCLLAVESHFQPDQPVFVVPLEVFTPKALPTWELLSVLSSLHPSADFSLIIGADNLESLERWANALPLLRYCRFLCCPRPGYEKVEVAV